MRHERQVELLSRLKGRDPHAPWPLAETCLRNPAAHYVDPARFEREREILFRKSPQLVGLSCELSKPGASLAANFGGVPVAIARQADGSLKGFVNACRHRGAPIVAAGDAPRPRLTCPFHGWVYDLDGALLARPYAEEAFSDVPAADCGLKPILVAEKHGLILAQLEGTGLDVDAALHGAQGDLAPLNLEGYTFIEARENTWNFNWKLIVDTFCEAYHIRALHKNSIAPHYLSEISFFDAYGPHPQQIGLLRTVLSELDKPDTADWRLLPHATNQLIFMPSGLITYQRDHVELWRVTPLAAGKTLVRTAIYAPDAPTSEKAWAYWRKNLDVLLEVTGREDFPMMQSVHDALAAGALSELIYGRNEPALIHLHQAINAALGEG